METYELAGARKKDRVDLVGKGRSFDRGGTHHEVFGSTEDRHGTLNLCGITERAGERRFRMWEEWQTKYMAIAAVDTLVAFTLP